jgi:hypothetical protein
MSICRTRKLESILMVLRMELVVLTMFNGGFRADYRCVIISLRRFASVRAGCF